jgi:hypothetical protein
MGEAATLLPDDLKAEFPEVPWQQPSRLRNPEANSRVRLVGCVVLRRRMCGAGWLLPGGEPVGGPIG